MSRLDALPVAFAGAFLTIVSNFISRVAGVFGAITLADAALWATIIAGASTFVASVLSGVLSLRRMKRESEK